MIKQLSNQQFSRQSFLNPSWQPQSHGYGVTESTVDTLNRDISDLIIASKADFAKNPWDNSIQTRLKALLDLQTILSSQKLPPDQIELIKNRVSQLSEAAHSSLPKSAPSQPKSAPLQPISAPLQPISPPAPVTIAQPSSRHSTLSSVLAPAAFAAFLARQSTTPQLSPSQAVAPVRSPPPSIQPALSAPAPAPTASTPLPDPSSLLEKLRAAGILQGSTPTARTPTLPFNALANKVPPGYPPESFANTPPNPSRTPLAEISNDVVLKPASLKL